MRSLLPTCMHNYTVNGRFVGQAVRMFWGLKLEEGKQYSQLVEKPFHISHATLACRDPLNSVFPDTIVELHAIVEKTDYLVCYLDASRSILQQVLDLNVSEGEEIVLYCTAHGDRTGVTVYLTGYFIEEPEVSHTLEDLTNDEYSVSEGELSEMGSVDGRPSALALLLAGDDLASDESDEDYFGGGFLPVIEEIREDDSEGKERQEEGAAAIRGKNGVKSTERKRKAKKHKREETLSGGGDSAASENGSPKKKRKRKQKSGKDPTMEPAGTPKLTSPQKKKPKAVKLKTGTEIQDIIVGSGKKAKPGKRVFVKYTGRLAASNKVFDSTTGQPFMFRLGQGEVIRGWDEGVKGMQVGGRRKILVPPSQAYGAAGMPPAIPPHSKLDFDVELIDVESG